jgi:septation ring formation regulator EzrA
LKIIERKIREITYEGSPGSDQYNDLFNNFTGQLQTITDDFNNQISGLRNIITSLSTYTFSANNLNYVNASNITKNLYTHLKTLDQQVDSTATLLKNTVIDVSKQLTYLTSVVCQCNNILINFIV